jgi:phosphoribosylaminoimidazole carboxylase (NCAIR synthetase)
VSDDGVSLVPRSSFGDYDADGQFITGATGAVHKSKNSHSKLTSPVVEEFIALRKDRKTLFNRCVQMLHGVRLL